jgi:hypothetical protein
MFDVIHLDRAIGIPDYLPSTEELALNEEPKKILRETTVA